MKTCPQCYGRGEISHEASEGSGFGDEYIPAHPAYHTTCYLCLGDREVPSSIELRPGPDPAIVPCSGCGKRWKWHPFFSFNDLHKKKEYKENRCCPNCGTRF